MSITYFDADGYQRYQVRVQRHGQRYTRAFNCRDGKRKAKQLAQKFERDLIAVLGTEPMTLAGRSRSNRKKSAQFVPYEEKGVRSNGRYIACGFRRPDGRWGRVCYSVLAHGRERAERMAVREAKKRHVKHPRRVKKKKMPSRTAIELKLAKMGWQ